MIIGLTGPIASGKTTIAEILKEKGFEYYTFSDILRIEAKKKGIEQTRENLQKLGADIKAQSSNPGILSRLIVENARKEKKENIVADGIRTVDEITELKKYDAYIIAVTAPQEERFRRLKKRARPGDPESFESFKKMDDDENKGKTKGQDINNCVKNADKVINNSKNAEQLKEQVLTLLSSLMGSE